MRDRRDRHDFATRLGLDRKNDDAGAILSTLFKSTQGFVTPEVGKADHQSGDGLGQRHSLFNLVIEGAGTRRRF